MNETVKYLNERIAHAQHEISVEEARTADLRVRLQAAIEAQISALHRELARVVGGQLSACSGECDMKRVLEAEQDLEENLRCIAQARLDIEDFKAELEENQ